MDFQSVAIFLVTFFVIPRLTFLPRSVHGLLILLGPLLLPRLVNAFNTARATSRSVPVRPTPPNVRRVLNLLSVSAVACIALSLPYFAPENVFMKTQSRLQIDPNVLFARLRLLRPLTEEDEVLRSKLGSFQNKLVYLTYGPDTLVKCIWCASADDGAAQNYFLYSVPKILTPHLLHLVVTGLATSSWVGKEGSRFRTHATIAGLLLGLVELWQVGTYDLSSHKKAKVLGDVDFVHWRVRFLRFVSFALVDIGLGLVLWLTSTNRWLAKPESLAERIEMTTREAEEVTFKLRALGILSNSINRNAVLRGFKESYWRTEGAMTADTVQDPQVAEQINKAVERMDMGTLEGQVSQVTDNIMKGIEGLHNLHDPSASGTAAGEAPS